jgi:lipopolysaccharide/colanic/teichoic acid biosynthesis glycosyltransferase
VKVLELLRRNRVKEIILAGPEAHTAYTNRLISQCREIGIDVCVVPNWYELYSSHAKLIDVGGLPLVKVENRNPQHSDLAAKRAFDLLLTAPIILLSSPIALLMAVSLMVRGRPAIYSELRCGHQGRPFRMFRFNIARHSRDLRGVDSLLDRVSFTELPQLLNVLRGEMSLVGPRPEGPARAQDYSDWQRQRLSVKPGMTGLAQVQGLRDQHSSDEKSRYDLQYIHDWSLLLDLSLLLQTALTLGGRVAQSRSRQSGRLSRQSTQTPPSTVIAVGEANVNRAQSGAD